jgi:ERF superfamily
VNPQSAIQSKIACHWQQERVTMSESTPSALAKALAAFQKNLPQISKDEKADAGRRGSYTYAGLDTVAAKVLPALAAVGLSYSATTGFIDDRRFCLKYSLLHESGESRDGIFPIPLVDDAQAMGSWLTYARRYTLLCVTGVHPGGEDDDGRLALPPLPAPAPSYRQSRDDGTVTTLSGSVPRSPATKPETGEPETGQVNERAQVLASLTHELHQRGCTVVDLKEKVYDIAKAESLLKGLVINPFDASMCQLSVVITQARKEAEQRAQVQEQLGQE